MTVGALAPPRGAPHRSTNAQHQAEVERIVEHSTEQKQEVSGEAVADRLDEATSQSGPAAAGVLNKATDKAREQASQAPVEEPGSFAHDAMQKAGNAEAAADGTVTIRPRGRFVMLKYALVALLFTTLRLSRSAPTSGPNKLPAIA